MAVELTPEQIESFNRRLATYGVSIADLEGKDHNTADVPAPMFSVGHPDGSPDLTGEVRTVTDLAMMKELGGVPDSHYHDDGISDGHIEYPPDPPHAALGAVSESGGDLCSLEDSLDADTIANARQAMRAYLLGDSTKAAAWEPLVNALYFPMDGTVINAGNVVVGPGDTLTISGPGPVTYNALSITVAPTGQIVCTTDVTFNVAGVVIQS